MKKPFAIIIISIFIFILSLPFTAVYTEPHNLDGLTCLLLGWVEMNGGGIAWMANPLLITATCCISMILGNTIFIRTAKQTHISQ
ncbi:Uncharacterised protein [Chryseobacterium gleum]|uniref:Uncharacterized protein n=2 Tax=Chryseobacterium gleum TaxID=250 RepID=A0A3S4M8K4_CHRGE|nr:hypothetical protein [Chryseobacterium gleum]EFK37930.1 hypothetical protein HMPREF0204_10703 [Chryseobacterium gleum ATCC 35910]QQY32614.1 hypothetical protein I6I60_02125 [Chryseobacterium gleum]VEE10166.1 Uncharacterised protein [Chryseobacterium gleum]